MRSTSNIEEKRIVPIVRYLMVAAVIVMQVFSLSGIAYAALTGQLVILVVLGMFGVTWLIAGMTLVLVYSLFCHILEQQKDEGC